MQYVCINISADIRVQSAQRWKPNCESLDLFLVKEHFMCPYNCMSLLKLPSFCQAWNTKQSLDGPNANRFHSSNPGQQRVYRGLHEQHLHPKGPVRRVSGGFNILSVTVQ